MEIKGDLLTLFALQDVGPNPQVAKQLADLGMPIAGSKPSNSKKQSHAMRQKMISPQRRL